jgi:membrane-associated PAP2 superfamily phosphatase
MESLIEISLGIQASTFLQMATSYQGPWDLVQLRGENFYEMLFGRTPCTNFAGVEREFWCTRRMA